MRLVGLKALPYTQRLSLLNLATIELTPLHVDLIWCYKIVFGLVDVACNDCFGQPFAKRFALSYRTVICPVCLSCLSERWLLWPNGWMDQDKTLHIGRPRPWPYCVRWRPSSPSPKRAQPQFSDHICCGQMAGWTKMPLVRKVGLDPSDIVLDEDWGNSFPFPNSSPFPKRGQSPPIFGLCLLWPNGCMDQDAIWYVNFLRCLVWR